MKRKLAHIFCPEKIYMQRYTFNGIKLNMITSFSRETNRKKGKPT